MAEINASQATSIPSQLDTQFMLESMNFNIIKKMVTKICKAKPANNKEAAIKEDYSYS